MRLTDEEITGLLRQALDPGKPAPPPESVRELRSLVSRAAPLRRALPLRYRVAVATAAFLGMSGSAVGAAVASGATLPGPLRVIASGMGLPVDSVDLAQAKTDADRLRRDLNRRALADVPRDAAVLQDQFAGLSTGERRSIGEEVDSLLDRAAPFDGGSGGGTEETSGSGSASGSGGPDTDGDPTAPTPTTVSGSRTSGSGDGGAVSGSTSGGEGSSGGSSPTTAPSATTGDSGGGSTSATSSGNDGGTTSGGGTSGGGTDGGSVSGSDGGG